MDQVLVLGCPAAVNVELEVELGVKGLKRAT
jgi:hypothetical protein